MKNTLGAVKTVAAAALLAMCALPASGGGTVTKARLGDLRRDNRVVVDVGGIDVDPVTSVNGKTGTVHLVAADVGAATMQDVADFMATNVSEVVERHTAEIADISATAATNSAAIASLAPSVAENTERIDLLGEESDAHAADISEINGRLLGVNLRADYLYRSVTGLVATADAYIPWLEGYATNNYYMAYLANTRVSYLEQWANAVSNQLLLADTPAGSLKRSAYFTTNNMQLVGTVYRTTLNHIRYLADDSRVPDIGPYMVSGVRSVVSTNDAGVVSASTYPVLTLYSDGKKVWTSDPLDSTNYGWLVALVLALVGSAGGVLWRYVAKAGKGKAADLLIEKTWGELKALRDDGNLVPGQQYRITDYVATTNGDMESQSANHRFDIIVTADDERTLNEHARAAIHEGDLPDDIVDGSARTKYFAGCDLAAWDVWYCLDNDTGRFAWEVADGGKGVVYRLVDEFHNDCPYDFKGIQFLAYGDTDNVWRYTFDSGDAGGNTDFSLHGGAPGDVQSRVCMNKILPYHGGTSVVRLNCIVFKGAYCCCCTFGAGCCKIKFGSASAAKSYCRYVRVASGNQCLYINPTGATSSIAYYQNVEIVAGVNNTGTYKAIDDPNVNQSFKTVYQPANSQTISI